MNANDFLALPPVQWKDTVEKMTTAERSTLSRELDHIASMAARAGAYVDARTQTEHDEAVKQMNRVARRVRAGMGYQVTTDMRI